MRPLVLAILLCGIFAMAQQTSVPVDQEPMHKVVLKNEYVEVLHVSIPPGQSTLFHTHSHDGVVVHLAEGQIRIDVPGSASTSEVQNKHPGDVSAQAYSKAPFTHRVNNVGKTPFEVIDIEFLKRPEGVHAKAIAAPAAENESARVYKWELAAGASSPPHGHERPYLVVSATMVDLRMTAPDGTSLKHAVQPGDIHWVDSKVTHTLINDGKAPGVIVEVELK